MVIHEPFLLLTGRQSYIPYLCQCARRPRDLDRNHCHAQRTRYPIKSLSCEMAWLRQIANASLVGPGTEDAVTQLRVALGALEEALVLLANYERNHGVPKTRTE